MDTNTQPTQTTQASTAHPTAQTQPTAQAEPGWTNQPHPTAARLLQDWTLLMVAFGLAIVLVPWVRDDLFGWIASGDAAYVERFGDRAHDYLVFNQTILGALTAGLGVAALWFARIPIARGERWGWNAFVSSIGLWYVVDCVASVATGFERNVVFNTVLIVPLLPLLWLTRPTA